jgi:hypothetical protein
VRPVGSSAEMSLRSRTCVKIAAANKALAISASSSGQGRERAGSGGILLDRSDR